ncbi:MAG: Nif3-like dinuclear metal center hexameric protein [Pirellulaceae bacterium]
MAQLSAEVSVQEICDFLGRHAPLSLAEEWDNVGLLVGDPASSVQRLMTCLTLTPASVDEAVRCEAQLLVTHHPLPFRPFKQLTTATVAGQLLLRIVRAGMAVYSAHTAYDSAEAGINQRLAEGCQLQDIQPLVPAAQVPELGSGRWGRLPVPAPLSVVTERVALWLGTTGLARVGRADQEIRAVAVACGSAGQFLSAARRAGCDLLITGETNFHTCLEAEAIGMGLLLTGHFASERFGMEQLAGVLAAAFPQLTVWASRDERDPLEWIAAEGGATRH